MDQLRQLWDSTGVANITVANVVMILIGGLLIWLAVKKKFEPLLLLPIGFGVVSIFDALYDRLAAPSEAGETDTADL